MEEERPRFSHPNPKIDTLYAFGEFDASFLETPIPEGVKNSQILDDDGEYVRQKNVEEFVVLSKRSLDNTKCIVLLSAADCCGVRYVGIDQFGLDDWKYYLEALGYSWDDMFEFDAYQILVNSDNYYKLI